jgi:dTDP-glucose 4,6-dehydratase
MTSEPLADRSVLVTGAGGFIGSHLVERLLEEDADVTALVEYNRSSDRGWLDEDANVNETLDVEFGDVRNPETIRDLVGDAEVVFHLAALVSVPHSYEAPRSHLNTNTRGTLNVLQAARDESVERIVHTSTSEVYGSARYVPIDEEHPLQAQSPYAASKIAADKMAEAFNRSYGLPVVTLRPFNTFGPRQSMRAVIPTIVVQCLEKDELELGNLDPIRDFNYVSNTVDGFLAASLGKPEIEGKVSNVGSGQGVSIREVAQTVINAVDHEVELVQDEDRVRPEDSEVDRLVAGTERGRKLLDWEPRVGFSEGIERTIEWFRSNKDHYRAEAYAR